MVIVRFKKFIRTNATNDKIIKLKEWFYIRALKMTKSIKYVHFLAYSINCMGKTHIVDKN